MGREEHPKQVETTGKERTHHRVDELGFQSSHANLVHEFPDEGGVLSSLGVAHHPKHQRRTNQNGDVVARDALLSGRSRCWDEDKSYVVRINLGMHLVRALDETGIEYGIVDPSTAEDDAKVFRHSLGNMNSLLSPQCDWYLNNRTSESWGFVVT